MTFNIDLNTLISSLAVVLISYGVKGIWALNAKVGTQNGRLGKIETWMDGHTKLDDERHTQVREGIAALWGKLDGE